MAFPAITKDTIWIVAGIDGTGSIDWARPLGSDVDATNSHVAKFVKAMTASYKKYFHGPNGPGTNADNIKEEVLLWINEQVSKVAFKNRIVNNIVKYEKTNIANIKDIRTITPAVSTWVSPTPVMPTINADIRLCLVGHSRGGAIAQDIAAKFPFRIYFLGLFDSVDRSWNLDGGDITNVEFTYHALRNPKMDSRPSFGNTGTQSLDGEYKSQMFWTSHGGVGGSYVDEELGMTSDYSCTSEPTVKHGIPISKEILAKNYKNYSSSSYLPMATTPVVMYTKVNNIADVCAKGSLGAWNFILEGAITKELPIK